MERLGADIARDGFSTMSLVGSSLGPVVSYTVGLLTSPAKSELIIFHDDEKQAHHFLKQVAKMLQEGVQLQHKQIIQATDSWVLRVMEVPVADALVLCSSVQWLYPDQAKDTSFYQLQVSRHEYEASGMLHHFPEEGAVTVSEYLASISNRGFDKS